MSSDRLTIATYNIQNLHSNLVSVLDACENTNIDIIFFCETRVRSGKLRCAWTQYHNYAIRREDHVSAYDHLGIAFFIRPNFPYEVRPLSIQNNETLTLKVGPYTLHGLYLPPSLPAPVAASRYRSLSVDPFTIVLGDLNVRLKSMTGDARYTPSRHHALTLWMSTNDLTVWNAELAFGLPTFETVRTGRHMKSIVDYFISMRGNLLDPRMTIHSDLGLSDHHMCELSFVPVNMSQLPASTAPRRSWRLQRLQDPEVLTRYTDRFQELTGTLMEDIQQTLENDAMLPRADVLEGHVQSLNEALYTALDSSVGRSRPPLNSHKWFWSDHLQHLADRRQQASARWRRFRNDLERATAYSDYVTACTDFRKAVRAARQQSWHDFCHKLQADPSEMTAAVKRMRLRQRSSVNISSPDGPDQAAEDMASHLERVFGGSVPLRPSPEGIFNREVHPWWTRDDIVSAIRYLPNRKAPGTDSIKAEMLKPVTSSIAPLLDGLFTICWQTS